MPPPPEWLKNLVAPIELPGECVRFQASCSPRVSWRAGRSVTPSRCDRCAQRIHAGGASVYLDYATAQLMLAELQLRGHETRPRHVISQGQPELGAQHVLRRSAAYRITASALEQRADEQLGRRGRGRLLGLDAPDENQIDTRMAGGHRPRHAPSRGPPVQLGSSHLNGPHVKTPIDAPRQSGPRRCRRTL